MNKILLFIIFLVLLSCTTYVIINHDIDDNKCLEEQGFLEYCFYNLTTNSMICTNSDIIIYNNRCKDMIIKEN